MEALRVDYLAIRSFSIDSLHARPMRRVASLTAI
jgi:hypothetical protein